MMNFSKILFRFGIFKTHFMKIQLSFIIFRKVLQNSVYFSQFQDTFTQKHHTENNDLFYFNL